MTPREMQNDFEYKVNRYDSDLIVNSDVLFHWLNESKDIMVKLMYSGNNPSREGFEETQLSTEFLRPLVKEVVILPTLGGIGDKPNSYIATLPTDLIYIVSDEVDITYTPTHTYESDSGETTVTGTEATKRVGLYPTTSDVYSKEVKSPYGQHVLHYDSANPLRLEKEDSVELVTDGNYTISTYYIRYIKQPATIQLGGPDCELPDHIHSQVVDRAVNLYLESIQDSRYQTTKQELSDKQ